MCLGKIAANSRAGGRFNAACALLADELKEQYLLNMK
jgi:hypothetical protein